MAGARDTPEKRGWRNLLFVSQDEPVQESMSSVQFGRRQAPGEKNALVASAARINLRDRRAIESMRNKRQAWQSEAWEYADEVPEIGNTVDYSADLISKMRLFAAVRPDPYSAPIVVDDDESDVDQTTAQIAIETLERLRSLQGGQSAILRELTLNLDIAGEAYLHGSDIPDTQEEDWQIRSVDELIVEGNRYVLRPSPGSTKTDPISDDDVVVRLWSQHPRFSSLATSPMRRILSVAETLLLLGREMRSISKSRMSAGVLKVPSELSFGPIDPTRDQGDGEAGDDPFLQDLTEAMTMPIQNEGSAAAVVPLVVTGPAESLKAFDHLSMARDTNASLDARIEGCVMRIARGLRAPVEVTTGLMNSTFANAATVRKSEWDAYGEPRAVLIVDALTAGYYQPALVEAGIPLEVARQIFIWFDPSDAIAAPDPTDNADKDHEDGIISDEARRRAHGWSEQDAPDDDEILRRLAFHATRMDPLIGAQILKKTGLFSDIVIPAPQSGVLGDAQGPSVDAQPIDKPAEPVAAAGARSLKRHATLGKKLTNIDSTLRTKLKVAADSSLKRALERANSRIRSQVQRDKGGEKSSVARVASSAPDLLSMASVLGPELVASMGLTNEEILVDSFGDLEPKFHKWIQDAQNKALNLYKSVGIKPNEARLAELRQKQDRDRQVAWDKLHSRLMNLAVTKLYAGPSKSLTAAMGEVDDSMDVSEGDVRDALATAGGSTTMEVNGAVLNEFGGPVGGVATGPTMTDMFSQEGGSIEGYEWIYGGCSTIPFPPHEDLAGVTFVNFDDDVLANNDDFPETDYYQAGDHGGCCCDIAPILIGPESEESE